MLSDETLHHLRDVIDQPDLSATSYRLIRRLGRGGMATVYLVEDRELRREVALKVLSDPDPAGNLAARLLAEARLLARLEHPNLAPVHDVGTLPDGRVFYVMKYVRGVRLDAWRRGDPTRPTALRLFQKICDAVAFAHAAGVVHRDLKPENIMIGEFGEALVMDWGVAKRLPALPAVGAASAATGPAAAAAGANGDAPTLALDPTAARANPSPAPSGTGAPITEAGSLIGTPAWMAPEQARGEGDRIDARTDVHALGALLYFLLSGRAPFEGSTPAVILKAAAEGLPRPLRQIDRSIPKPLEAICSRAMARDPADRYDSARSLAADVERHLDGLAVLAYPETLPERAGRLARQNRVLLLMVAAYLVMRLVVLFFAGR